MPSPLHPAVDKRARWLLRLLLFWGFAIVCRLFYLQIIRHDYYADFAYSQQTRLVEIPAHRGSILDRNGHILALSVPISTVIVNPAQLPDVDVAATILANILGLDELQLRSRLAARKNQNRGYFKVAEHVNQEQVNRLKTLSLDWIQFESSSARLYPNDHLAAHILGGVDFEKRGNGGIEQGMEDELGGRPGFASMVTDVRHRGFESNIEVEPIPGNDVALTIDYRVQYELEKLLAQSVESEKCWSGRGIVMDPHTGEILAMASFPTYNPNGKVTDLEARQNLPVQSAIEPGSVFKIFTIASALEEKTVKPSSSFNCHHGKFNLFGRIIRDSTKNGYGYLTVEDILAKSSNIGSIQVGMTVGDKLFHKYILDFGFGARTGLPLPGESTGRVRRLSKWTKSSIGSVAMGHEIMATTVQLAQGASIIANGGKFVRPKLVHHVTTPSAGGFAIRKISFSDPPSRPKQILSPETVVQMRKMMEHVVLAGTGTNAKIRGYSVGGKTGSAQIYDPKSKQYLHRYHASFMGFTPVNDPRLVTVITLNGSSVYGGVIAAPVFSKVTEAALRVLNIPRDLPDTLVTSSQSNPQVTPDAAFPLLNEENPVEEVENSSSNISTTLITPNFLGLTLRQVLEQAGPKGFRIDPAGAGLVRQQSPAPGEPIAYGQRIKLRLGR